jgi:hypothetical protein
LDYTMDGHGTVPSSELGAVKADMIPKAGPKANIRPVADLDANMLPPLDWQSERVLVSLETLFRWVEQNTIRAYDWYMREKETKARLSKTTRVGAVALLTIGGILPLLSLITDRRIAGEWGFVALACGAGLLLLDRVFGLSSSWARYVSAAVELQMHLTQAQLHWARRRIGFANQTPDSTEIQRAVAEIEGFAMSVNDVIRRETEQWMVEFHENVTELRASLGTHPR